MVNMNAMHLYSHRVCVCVRVCVCGWVGTCVPVCMCVRTLLLLTVFLVNEWPGF